MTVILTPPSSYFWLNGRLSFKYYFDRKGVIQLCHPTKSRCISPTFQESITCRFVSKTKARTRYAATSNEVCYLSSYIYRCCYSTVVVLLRGIAAQIQCELNESTAQPGWMVGSSSDDGSQVLSNQPHSPICIWQTLLPISFWSVNNQQTYVTKDLWLSFFCYCWTVGQHPSSVFLHRWKTTKSCENIGVFVDEWLLYSTLRNHSSIALNRTI